MNTIDNPTSSADGAQHEPGRVGAGALVVGEVVAGPLRRAARARARAPSPATPSVATSWYQTCPNVDAAIAVTSASRPATPPAVFVAAGSSHTWATTQLE